MTTPAITVLIPCYNAGDLLLEAVNSILMQTFTDFECLILDDGSTDSSVQQLKAIRDTRLRVVRNEQNLGLIATLNRGLEIARAPLLARMDADDLSLPTRLERQVARFDSHPTLALLGTWAENITCSGKIAGVSRVPINHDQLIRAMLQGNAFIHPSIMARTAVLRELGGYPIDALHAEDYALWLRVVTKHQVANLPEVLLQYRVHAGQVSQRKLRAQLYMACRLQQWARHEFLALGLIAATDLPPLPTFLDKLKAHPGTLGADYRGWAKRNWKLGNWRNGSSAAFRGLLVSPLCGELWRLLTPPVASPRYWARRIAARLLR